MKDPLLLQCRISDCPEIILLQRSKTTPPSWPSSTLSSGRKGRGCAAGRWRNWPQAVPSTIPSETVRTTQTLILILVHCFLCVVFFLRFYILNISLSSALLMIKNVWSNAVKMNKKSKLFYLADVFLFFFKVKHLKKNKLNLKHLIHQVWTKNRKCPLQCLIKALRWHFHAIL